ncbi:apolipoprotein N-acyltransferase [Leptospira bandrabouensis]|uniref:apolipoprotein N-acyltransferase n=1 Tax=Leptospira bandrabouensis TaxID=2484903 RepID=UPI00223E7031|nr:nitrilase-related carbon-nitrogen hydrolase [Leptospira bandrabouensis]MCW7458437.1 apolipoprotein N-acyltransferase [Leptospira bandrabouensis]MCW7478816.1 apolipoprotein N-acyltransferase [Leptospira bandrabouensis]MCW7486520.1 apolipoprotein N-acyltransferase [Leptospira bandrabouensis]
MKLVRFLISREGFISVICYAVTAVFSFLSFAPLSLPFFVWFAPFGLFLIEKRNRGEWKKLIYHGFGFSILFYFVSFHWIYHMTTVFGGFDWYLAVPIFIGSAILLNFKFPVYLLLFSFLAKRVGKFFPIIASFSILFAEFFTPQVFPWYFGNVVAENQILAQNAEYVSSYGLSAFLFFVSYYLFSLRKPKTVLRLLTNFLTKHKNFQKQFLLGGLSLVLVLVLFFGNGYYLFQKWSNVKPIAERDVLIVQPNAPLEFRDGRNPAEEIRNLMTRIDLMTERELKENPADLVVLPESGVPFFTTHDSEVTRYSRIYWHQFESLMAIISLRHGTNVFYNELDADLIPTAPPGRISRRDVRMYNSSVIMNPNGERRNSYQKVFLLIFGEYMPFEWMYALSGQTGQFAPGTNLNLIPYYEPRKTASSQSKDLHFEDTMAMGPEGVREYYSKEKVEEKQIGSFLPLICYEVIISEFVRKFEGYPDFIVNVTNDKWYGNSVESYQHHTLGRLRAIEFRKWIVRSTNSGTSVFTDHLGRNIDNDFTPIESTAVIRKKVQVIPGEMTFYRLYGNLLSYLYLGIVGLVFFFYAKRNS